MASPDVAGALANRLAPFREELEAARAELAARRDALANELMDVEAELQRIDHIQRTMTAPPARVSSVRARERERSHESARDIIAWARDRDDFDSADVATFLGVSVNAVTSILTAMVRRGEISYRENGRLGRRYRVKGIRQ